MFERRFKSGHPDMERINKIWLKVCAAQDAGNERQFNYWLGRLQAEFPEVFTVLAFAAA
jgi:Tfp pilus assembly protein PilF